MILLASFYMSRMMCSIDGISTVFFILLPLLSMVFDGYGPLLVDDAMDSMDRSSRTSTSSKLVVFVKGVLFVYLFFQSCQSFCI